MTILMSNEYAMNEAFRLHGIGQLEKQTTDVLTRLAGALIEQEEHFECLIEQDDLGDDAKEEYRKMLEWIAVVYKAVDALLSKEEAID